MSDDGIWNKTDRLVQSLPQIAEVPRATPERMVAKLDAEIETCRQDIAQSRLVEEPLPVGARGGSGVPETAIARQRGVVATHRARAPH